MTAEHITQISKLEKGSLINPREAKLETSEDVSVLDILRNNPADRSYTGSQWVKCAIAMGVEIEKTLRERASNEDSAVKDKFIALFTMVADSCKVPFEDRSPLDHTINNFASALHQQAYDYCESEEWGLWEFGNYSHKVEADCDAVDAELELDARGKILEQAVGMYEMFEHWSNIDPTRS